MSNQEVNARNTESFNQQQKELTKKVFEQQTEIDGLKNTIGTLTARLDELERKYMLLLAKSLGTGSTVK